MILLALFFYSFQCSLFTHAVVPLGELSFENSFESLYVSVANFGSSLSPSSSLSYSLRNVEEKNNGCSEFSDSIDGLYVIPRGNCSFYEKSYNAMIAGASGVIIYNSLENVYGNNAFANSVDYDCSNGQAYVDTLKYPLYGTEMTELMPETCTQDSLCDSHICVVTNVVDDRGTKVCCLWDLYIRMDSDKGNLEIPVVYMRIRDAETLMSYYSSWGSSLKLFLMARSDYGNLISTLLLWIFAVFCLSSASVAAGRQIDMNSSRLISEVGNLDEENTPLLEKQPHRPMDISTKLTYQIDSKIAIVCMVCCCAFLISLYYLNYSSYFVIFYLILGAWACFELIYRFLLWAASNVWRSCSIEVAVSTQNRYFDNALQFPAALVSLCIIVLWNYYKLDFLFNIFFFFMC